MEQSTPVANRTHIGFFGCRNAGKSSVVNAVTGQDLAVVSEVLGTTTDPVTKTMELLPLGPVVIIDTPGIDDVGALGEKRIKKTRQILNKTDIAVLVVDGTVGLCEADRQLLRLLKEKEIPRLLVYNKADLSAAAEAVPSQTAESAAVDGMEAENILRVSAATGQNIRELKERLAHLRPDGAARPLVSDLLETGDCVILVTPIDEAAPKGRLILPQQQVLREALECGATVAVTRETELAQTLQALKEAPRLVITDSQAFAYVARVLPDELPLTSFSILMARYKGFLSAALDGIRAISRLKDGDTVLIAEGCTHHRQCNDIGTVKIPNWLRAHTGKDLCIRTCSGTEFPEDLSGIAAVIHCGGCMLNEREVRYRMKCALDQGVPFTNYGILIAHINGILERSVAPLP